MTDLDTVLSEGERMRKRVEDYLREFNEQAPALIEGLERNIAETEKLGGKAKWWVRP